MNYYEENPQTSRRWAWVALVLYGITVALAGYLVRIDGVQKPPQEPILVELAPLPEPEPEPRPQPAREQPQQHEVAADEEQHNEVRGQAEQTRTVNPRALFRQSQGGVDDPENAGNPKAAKADQDSASGKGSGMAPEGSDWLDKGLQGRGLVGSLPKPRYTGNVAGKVVVRVTVDQTGRVTAAAYEPKGSTTSHPDLVQEAIQAALQARFTESRSFVQGGTITYIFTLKR